MFGCDFAPFAVSALGGAMAVARHAATTALVARMAVAPSSARIDAIDALIVALAGNGLWDKLEALYVPAAHQAQAALLDWTDRHGAATIAGGAPTFVADRGYHVDGIDDWIDLGFAPSQGVRFQQNSAMVAMWARNANANQTASGLGLLGSNQVGLNPRGSGGGRHRG